MEIVYKHKDGRWYQATWYQDSVGDIKRVYNYMDIKNIDSYIHISKYPDKNKIIDYLEELDIQAKDIYIQCDVPEKEIETGWICSDCIKKCKNETVINCSYYNNGQEDDSWTV